LLIRPVGEPNLTLRLGFIGTGINSQKHLQGIVELNQIIDAASDPAYELVAVADPPAKRWLLRRKGRLEHTQPCTMIVASC
jgi:hypothetical protein